MSKQLSYTTISYFLCRALFIGLTFSILIKEAKQDSWLSLILAFILGFIPVLLIHYIASYQPEKSLKQKYEQLFPYTNKLLMLLTGIGIFLLATLSFWNLCNLITSQFLNKTPKIVVGISFIVPIILILSKEEKVIPRVSTVLFYLSFFLFILSFIGLIFQFNFDNFTPSMIYFPTKPIITYIGFQVFPIFLLLFFPNSDILKSIKKGYMLSSIILFINVLLLIGVLGVELATIYQYPEFHILKRAYQGVLTYRLENALATQWIFDIFIYCVVSLKGCNQFLNFEKGFKMTIVPIIMLFLSAHLFKDNTIANTLMNKYFFFLVPLFFTIIVLLLAIKIFYKKRSNTPILKTDNQKMLK